MATRRFRSRFLACRRSKTKDRRAPWSRMSSSTRRHRFSWPTSGRDERAGVDAERADRGPRGMTVVRGGGGGVGWIWEPFRSSWKLRPRGSTAPPTGRRCDRCPARHGAGHTRAFDQQVAWLATQCSKRAITELMRIAWRTVAAIITRVWADTAAGVDAFAGLRRVGIDEISYKLHQKYLTVVVDHDSGRLVWACPGRERATVHAFFDALEASGQGRCAQITHVSADGAEWIADVVRDRCPDAIRCADPFHVVGWATEAVDA